MIFPYDFDSTRPTELCRIMHNCGSDKGHTENKGHHNYTTFYSALFEPVRHKKLKVFELGLGTNNTSVPSNMGPDGKPGASLRGWKNYFPNAEIVGADIDSDILFSEERIRTFWCDQLSPPAIKNMWKQPGNTELFDIIIEDGLHTFDANVCFFENSIHKVKPGGVFIIEDILLSNLARFETQIKNWSEKYPTLKFHLVNIPHTNKSDNCILVALC